MGQNCLKREKVMEFFFLKIIKNAKNPNNWKQNAQTSIELYHWPKKNDSMS